MSIEVFSIEEETDEAIKQEAIRCNSIYLCIIAPFTPLRVAPRRSLSAQFNIPDEFTLEEFIQKVKTTYPNKDERPSLHLLIHSPGGTTSSSYVVAKLLRKTFKNITGFIPHMAASGASVLSLGCDELIMGDISRLTGIDPYTIDEQGERHALSIVRAFRNLEDKLGRKTIEEISFPYQHLVQSITAEEYDEATHALALVRNYATELMKDSGYTPQQIGNILKSLLYDVSIHEEVFMLEKLQEIGVKVKYWADSEHKECWPVITNWLKKYYLRPSPIHLMRYCFPIPISQTTPDSTSVISEQDKQSEPQKPSKNTVTEQKHSLNK